MCSFVFSLFFLVFSRISLGPLFFLLIQPFYSVGLILLYARMLSQKKEIMEGAFFVQYFKNSFKTLSIIAVLHFLCAVGWSRVLLYVVDMIVAQKGAMFWGVGFFSVIGIVLFFLMSYFCQQIIMFSSILSTGIHFPACHGHLTKAFFFSFFAIRKNKMPFLIQAFLSIALVFCPLPMLIFLGYFLKVPWVSLQILYLIYCSYFFLPVYFGSLYEAYVSVFYES